MRHLTLLLLIALASPAVLASAPDDHAATLRHIKEVLWPQAYREQDVALLDRLLADEFQMIDASGAWFTKADELAWVAEHATNHDRFRYTIRRLDVFANGTAVVSGEGLVHGQNDEGAWRMTYQSSNVLILRDGRWQAIASHVSGIDREPATD